MISPRRLIRGQGTFECHGRPGGHLRIGSGFSLARPAPRPLPKRRGQGTFEYILLLGGAILVTTLALTLLTNSQPKIDAEKQCTIAARQNLACFTPDGTFQESRTFLFNGQNTLCHCKAATSTTTADTTVSPTASSTPSPSPTNTPSPTASGTPTATASASATPTTSPTPEPTPSPSPTASAAPSGSPSPTAGGSKPPDNDGGASPSPSASPTPTPSPTPSPSPTPVPASWASCQVTKYIPLVSRISSGPSTVFSGKYDLSVLNSGIPPEARITSVYLAPRDQGDHDDGGCPNVYFNGQLANNPSCTVCTSPSGGAYCGSYGFQAFAGPINYQSPGIQLPITFSGTVSTIADVGYETTYYASLHGYATISYRAPTCS